MPVGNFSVDSSRFAFSSSITFDLKAFNEDVHLTLTGASAEPALRNAAYVGKYAKNQIWEYRIVVIPKINENEIKPLIGYIASSDPTLPVCFLACRPYFALEHHPGADRQLMQRCVETARQSGLENVSWAGYTGVHGTIAELHDELIKIYPSGETQLAGSYALNAGCQHHPRNCGVCDLNHSCMLRCYFPGRST